MAKVTVSARVSEETMEQLSSCYISPHVQARIDLEAYHAILCKAERDFRGFFTVPEAICVARALIKLVQKIPDTRAAWGLAEMIYFMVEGQIQNAPHTGVDTRVLLEKLRGLTMLQAQVLYRLAMKWHRKVEAQKTEEQKADWLFGAMIVNVEFVNR